MSMSFLPDEFAPWVTPWDGLLLEVRRSAYRVSWIDARIEEILTHERQLRHEGAFLDDQMQALRDEIRVWLRESRSERQHLARVSAAAISAGFVERSIRQVELEAQTIARVLAKAIDALELDDTQRITAARALREALEDETTQRRASVIQLETSPTPLDS